MTEEKKEKDKELKKLYKETFTRQIIEGENFIRFTEEQIAGLKDQVQRQHGVVGYARHMLAEFDIPEKPAEPKKLEVK